MTTPSASTKLSIVDQVKEATKKSNRMATYAGFVLGGFVPVASFVLAHLEVHAELPLWKQLPAFLVIGGLIYSAKTVFDWASMAFKNPWKALGFVVLTEGVMTASETRALAFTALALLVIINGVATGCNLALDSKSARASLKK